MGLLAAGCQSIPGGLLACAVPYTGHGDHGGDTCPPASPSVPPASAPAGCRGRGSRRSPLHRPLSGSARWRGTARGEKGAHARGCWRCGSGDRGVLGTVGCRAPWTHQAVLMDAESTVTAELPDDLGVTICPLAQPAHCWGTAALSLPAPCGCAGGGNAGSGMGERPEHPRMVQRPLLAQPGTGRDPLWQVPGGLLCAHLPPGGPDASFCVGEAQRRVLPARPAELRDTGQGGSAAPFGAATSAPSLQVAAAKEMAGRGDVGAVEDRPDPPAPVANAPLSRGSRVGVFIQPWVFVTWHRTHVRSQTWTCMCGAGSQMSPRPVSSFPASGTWGWAMGL